MLKTGLNFLVDGFWGSSGKGKIAAHLAREAEFLSTCNSPNAGHTVVQDGQKWVFKVLPSGCASKVCHVLLGAGSVFDVGRLNAELQMVDYASLQIHDRAVLLQRHHVDFERQELRRIASTMQGSAAAYVDKVLRRPLGNGLKWSIDGATWLNEIERATKTKWLHEVAQGFALSVDHGSHYPTCTYRNCTPQAALDQLCAPVSAVRRVFLVVRPFPIRVGNLEGYSSGDWYADQAETDWPTILEQAGAPQSVVESTLALEHTTVTKRLRRVATFSWSGLARAAQATGATDLVLNFAQYLDWRAHDKRSWETLPPRVMTFVAKMEQSTGLPVSLIGTGADTQAICERP